jgi:hypothetical protein
MWIDAGDMIDPSGAAQQAPFLEREDASAMRFVQLIPSTRPTPRPSR